jgi:hypothetical protein
MDIPLFVGSQLMVIPEVGPSINGRRLANGTPISSLENKHTIEVSGDARQKKKIC